MPSKMTQRPVHLHQSLPPEYLLVCLLDFDPCLEDYDFKLPYIKHTAFGFLFLCVL